MSDTSRIGVGVGVAAVVATVWAGLLLGGLGPSALTLPVAAVMWALAGAAAARRLSWDAPHPLALGPSAFLAAAVLFSAWSDPLPPVDPAVLGVTLGVRHAMVAVIAGVAGVWAGSVRPNG